MTEPEWLACEDPERMLNFIRGRASGRQFRLFAAACARDDLQRGLETGEWFDFGHRVSDEDLRIECKFDPEHSYETEILHIESLVDGGERWYGGFWQIAWNCPDELIAYGALGYDPTDMAVRPPSFIIETIRRYTIHPAHYLRDIFPFHPVTFLPEWRTSTVLALAEAMYESRDFSPMPILADALEDANCSDETILTHCRGPGPHVRGCFCVDACLGKA